MSKLSSRLVSGLDGGRGVETLFSETRLKLLKIASAETSCNPKAYDKTISPLHLHCGAVANLIKVIYEGDIVSGKINGITHYWNRLSNGQEIDLTSCQFGGDGFLPLKKGRRVKERKGLTPLRFLLFAMRFRDELDNM